MSRKVLVEHARSEDQKAVLSQITADGVCPFCIANLKRYHKKPITESDHWFVTENQWPYDHTKLQLLVIAKRHVEHISELTSAEWRDWSQVVSSALTRYSIHSGAICMRFGTPEETGASVVHLHSHIIVPDSQAPEPVRFKIGGNKK